MLHEMIRNDNFQRNTALQCWNNVANIQNNIYNNAVMLLR